MRKSFLKIAAVAAASILAGFSFVSCEDDDTKNEFESKTFAVKLPTHGDMPGYGPSYHYEWRWTNRTEAAADSISFDIVDSGTLTTNDSVKIPTTLYTPYKELWTFRTKETGERELKFNYMKVSYGINPDGKDYVSAKVLRDTVIKF